MPAITLTQQKSVMPDFIEIFQRANLLHFVYGKRLRFPLLLVNIDSGHPLAYTTGNLIGDRL